MKYYLTCGECGREPEHVSFRGDRLVHRCSFGHQTTEMDERWIEKVVAVWDGPPLAVPASIQMRRYNVRKWAKRMWMKEPSLRLRAIVRLKEMRHGRR